jgi:hypothetical protein
VVGEKFISPDAGLEHAPDRVRRPVDHHHLSDHPVVANLRKDKNMWENNSLRGCKPKPERLAAAAKTGYNPVYQERGPDQGNAPEPNPQRLSMHYPNDHTASPGRWPAVVQQAHHTGAVYQHWAPCPSAGFGATFVMGWSCLLVCWLSWAQMWATRHDGG